MRNWNHGSVKVVGQVAKNFLAKLLKVMELVFMKVNKTIKPIVGLALKRLCMRGKISVYTYIFISI